MYTVGLSTCNKVISEELFKNYKDAGIRAMEISIPQKSEMLFDYKEVYQLAKKYSVNLWSHHFPFGEVEISKREFALKSVPYLEELIKRGTDIGIDKFVIHPSGEPIGDEERLERMKHSKENLAKLAETAAKNGAVIAVENLPRTCLGRNSTEILELISADDRLRVCFDTNHLLSEDPAEFVRRVGNKIITTHVSDYDFVDEKHWLPGEGKIDWQSIIKAFADISYDGVWLYELGFGSTPSMPRIRDLTCYDFVENAKWLFGK